MRYLPWLANREYPLLIEPMRERLIAAGVPWVIENVEDAPMPSSIVLCGWSMGLRFYRHRRFGSSQLLFEPPHRKHVDVIAGGRASMSRRYTLSAGVTGVLGIPPGHCVGSASAAVQEVLGITWMRRDELTQAIPPAYTEWIGRQLLAAVLYKEEPS
jgi:DNA (cytosine-5)-methyltransferase 1